MPPRLGLRPALGPSPPTANANGPYACQEGTSILASRLGSNDPYGAYDVYWTPGDGQAELGPYVGAAGDIPITYATAGSYLLQLRVVSQTTGLQDIATTIVVVSSVAAAAAVTVDPTSLAGSVGDVLALTATVTDSLGNVLPNRTITWTTDNGTVAAPNATAGQSTTVSLLAAGTANVRAHCEGIDSALVPVTVTATIAVGSVVVTPAGISGIVGQQVGVTAEVRASGAATVQASRFYFSLTKVNLGTTPSFASSWKAVTGGWPGTFPAALVIDHAGITGIGGQPDPWYSQAAGTWATTDAFGILQFISQPFAGAGILSGTIKGRIRARENTADANANVACVLRVISGDGATVRGTALAMSAGSATGDSNPEAPVATDNTGAMNRELPYGAGSPVALTDVAYQDGDRLLLEVGLRFAVSNPPATKVGYVVTTSIATSDLPEDVTTTADGQPWIEFSQLLTLQA